MLKIAYLIPYEYEYLESLSPGVAHKIAQQVKAMNTEATECKLICLPSKQSFIGKIIKRCPLAADGIQWASFNELDQYDCVYLRKPDYFSKEMTAFLSKAKITNPTIKLILEIPTFPYEKELAHSIIDLPKLLKDRYHKKKATEYVDAITSPADISESEFNTPCLRFVNGIDLSDLSARVPSLNPSSINVVCVAAFAMWHGADRLISGLSRYYVHGGTRRIILHFVGSGPDSRKLQRLADKLGLLRCVQFHGQCNRAQMDEVYDKCTLAVECLGIHRKDSDMVSSSLKSREYLAKGIPFIYSGNIDVFEKDPVNFCFNVPADESPVDFEKVIAFHDRLYSERQEESIIREIRRYAENHVGMDATMRPVIEYIKEAMNGQ